MANNRWALAGFAHLDSISFYRSGMRASGTEKETDREREREGERQREREIERERDRGGEQSQSHSSNVNLWCLGHCLPKSPQMHDLEACLFSSFCCSEKAD